jgi:hypothetical protein
MRVEKQQHRGRCRQIEHDLISDADEHGASSIAALPLQELFFEAPFGTRPHFLC